MWFIPSIVVILSVSSPVVYADWLGAAYPPPQDLSSKQSLVFKAWQNASAALDAYLKNGTDKAKYAAVLNGTEDVTFSAGLFSLHDAAASQLQYHYTAPDVATNGNQTRKVDGDSLYHVESVSKLITVLALLRTLSDEQWRQSVVNILPELATNNGTNSTGPVWEQITPLMLASQLSGIQNEPVGDAVDYLATIYTANDGNASDVVTVEAANGLPAETDFSLITCALRNCTVTESLASLQNAPPSFAPDYTAAYADTNFMVLGSILNRVTGKDFESVYQDLIFGPLGMTSSTANAPVSGPLLANSVVVGPIAGNWAGYYDAFQIPSGGIVSTINDLNRLGVGILNYTLLSEAATRDWMKPRAHTASLTFSVGAPWEIVRYVHPDTQKVTDVYAKTGDYGNYGGYLAVLPEYGAGFTFLNHGNSSAIPRSILAMTLIDFIGEVVVPSLEAQAAAEAYSGLLGTYVSSDGKTNSSLTVSRNETVPGLIIDTFISNGTNLLGLMQKIGASGNAPASPVHLLLTMDERGEGARNVTFAASLHSQSSTYMAAGVGPWLGMYYGNFDFFQFDPARYAKKSVTTFKFEVDANGNAMSVMNQAIGLPMTKAKSGRD